MTWLSRRPLRLIAAAVALGAAVPAMAATTTGTLNVSGTVVASCTLTTTAVNFGVNIPSPLVGNIDATGTITATCSNTIPYTIALNAGTGVGASVATRRLTSGANTLNYALYRDLARTQLWGDGSLGTGMLAGTGTGAAQAITVYGRIPTGQAPALGAYADSVTVTITF